MNIGDSLFNQWLSVGSPTPCPLDCVRAYKVVAMSKCSSPKCLARKTQALVRLPTLLSKFGLSVEATDYAIRVAKELGLEELEIIDLYYLKIVRMNMQGSSVSEVFDEMMAFSEEKNLAINPQFQEIIAEMRPFVNTLLDKSSHRQIDSTND